MPKTFCVLPTRVFIIAAVLRDFIAAARFPLRAAIPPYCDVAAPSGVPIAWGMIGYLDVGGTSVLGAACEIMWIFFNSR
jgi:hypothetical protein